MEGSVVCDVQGTIHTEQEHLHLLDRRFGRPQGLFREFLRTKFLTPTMCQSKI